VAESETVFRFCDDLGPARIVHIYQPALGLKGILVVDNIAAGPSIGGVRMAPDVSLEECFRLARAMTLKNAAATLPHGGGKSVIFGDPHMPIADKQRLVRAFAGAIADEHGYIAGPDMGTDERCMAWIKDEIGRSVGLPSEIGGIPLDEIGATGFGLCAAALTAKDYIDLDLDGARVAIQGFGSVGRHAARFLAMEGAVLVAAADSGGTVHDPNGLDIDALLQLKADGKSVTDLGKGEKLSGDDIVAVECDIWIPAARPDVIRADNVERMKTRLVLEGANIPSTPEAEQYLHDNGVLVVPDFIANAGGVICASVEYHGGTESIAFQVIGEKISANTKAVLDEAKNRNLLPRAAAERLARRRVEAAMALGRWSAPDPS